MVRQLQAVGEHVALLAIFDAFAPLRGNLPPQLERMGDAKVMRIIAGVLERFAGGALRLDHASLAGMPLEAQLELIERRVADAGLLAGPAAGGTLRGVYALLRASEQETLRYLPEGISCPRILLIRSTELHEDDRSTEWTPESWGVPTLGWERFSPHPVEVITVPGEHITMMLPPNVQALAEQLREVLNAVSPAPGEARPL
jgi:thioesterase domain-containing protein